MHIYVMQLCVKRLTRHENWIKLHRCHMHRLGNLRGDILNYHFLPPIKTVVKLGYKNFSGIHHRTIDLLSHNQFSFIFIL